MLNQGCTNPAASFDPQLGQDEENPRSRNYERRRKTTLARSLAPSPEMSTATFVLFQNQNNTCSARRRPLRNDGRRCLANSYQQYWRPFPTLRAKSGTIFPFLALPLVLAMMVPHSRRDWPIRLGVAGDIRGRCPNHRTWPSLALTLTAIAGGGGPAECSLLSRQNGPS